MKRNIYTEELKQIQLAMMDDIHTFCEEYGIRYFLAYGTLLGAIRHKGYIPWDDDIDIWMPRPDYERFIELYNKKDSYYRMACFEINKDYMLPFGKVHDIRTVMNETMYKEANSFGVYIDVFPLDGIINERQLKQAQRLRRILNAKKAVLRKGRSIFKDSIIALAKVGLMFKSEEDILLEIDHLVKKASFNTSPKVGYLPTLYQGIRGIYPREYFESFIIAEFEGRKYRIPSNYDTILTSEYGNYMQAPPEDKRISTHVFEAWWKE